MKSEILFIIFCRKNQQYLRQNYKVKHKEGCDNKTVVIIKKA